jgi:NAD(P)-dependent dehydrogenase (short-subunit alcohol dehydrogenase family)
MAEAGANLVITSRHEGEAAEAAAGLARAYGRRAFGMAADVVDEAAVNAVVARADRELGGVDILVNNAGITFRKPTVEHPLDDWRKVVDVNLTGPFLASKTVIPGMTKKAWGRVIHLASIFGMVGMPGRPAYVASKGAVVQLARAQALELAKNGRHCERHLSRAVRHADEQNAPGGSAEVPGVRLAHTHGSLGELPEIAGALVFLASNAASYLTGVVLPVDGGWTAH